MKVQEAIAQQFGLMYKIAATNLEGITSEQSLAQPSPGGNCANWLLGHLTNVQNGFEPISGRHAAIDWNTLRDRFLGSRDRCLAAISAQSDERLAESVPHPFGGTCTRAELLNVLAFHQAYHGGQLAMSRRIAGLEGAVKGPGQAQAVKA